MTLLSPTVCMTRNTEMQTHDGPAAWIGSNLVAKAGIPEQPLAAMTDQE